MSLININTNQSTSDIVSRYSSAIWATADVLRGVGAKASEWPNHMMPFFSLMLVESRALRAREEALNNFGDFDPKDPDDIHDFMKRYKATTGMSQAHHEDLVIHGQGLAHIVSGGPSGFYQRLKTYLGGYDENTRNLLGVNPENTSKTYLNIIGTAHFLDGHGGENLWQYCKMWSQVDLVAYDSSAVTTLEEHIKRKWADISADTAGEHYTPADLIDLIGDIAKSYFTNHPMQSQFLKIYDPTCGGGNMLFGVESVMRDADKKGELLNKDGHRYSIQTYGQELNDQLYALATIEGRHRPHALIKEGNTLSNDQFHGDTFDLIVANPPYGTDWKQIQKTIEDDTSGRFPSDSRPSVSDGQHLFLQHIQNHLSDEGIAMVFCSGSTLFSGDAGGGESNARSRYILKDDGVWGIIQLPKNEFFNTGINTYLWIFVKKKPEYLKNKMFLLNAETLFSKMRKSLGNKNSEMVERDRTKVVRLIEAVTNIGPEFDLNREKLSQDNIVMTVDVANRIGEQGVIGSAAQWGDNPTLTLPQDKWAEMNAIHLKTTPAKQTSELEPALLRWFDTQDLHYTKVTLELTRGGERAFKQNLEMKNCGIRFKLEDNQSLELQTGDSLADVYEKIEHHRKAEHLSIDPVTDTTSKNIIAALKQIIGSHIPYMIFDPNDVHDMNRTWVQSENDNIKQGSAKPEDYFIGKVTVTPKIAKGKTNDALSLIAKIGPLIEKDTEVAPFKSDDELKKQAIHEFLNKWVKDEYQITQEQIGCEINFNRLFPKTSERKTLADINLDLAQLDAQIALLHKDGV